MKDIGIKFVLSNTDVFYVWADGCDVDLTHVIETIQRVVKGKAPVVTTMLSKMRSWTTRACVGSRPAGVSEFGFEVDLVQNRVTFRRVGKVPMRMTLLEFECLSAKVSAALMRHPGDIVLYRSRFETMVTTDAYEGRAARLYFATRDRAEYTRIEIDDGHAAVAPF